MKWPLIAIVAIVAIMTSCVIVNRTFGSESSVDSQSTSLERCIEFAERRSSNDAEIKAFQACLKALEVEKHEVVGEEIK